MPGLPSTLRMFAAVRPSEEAVAHLDAFLEVRRDAAPFRWSDPDHFHLTCAFYPAVPERKLDDLIERLERAAAKRTAFEARLSGGGAFPHPAGARVLWVGVALDEVGEVELPRLAMGCRAAGTRAGAPAEGQRFTPHLTVARLGRPAEVSNWVRLLETYQGPAWSADTLTLVASYLGQGRRGRPRYEIVAESPLTK
ncbi:RNA 2',3'-cyclic phosphodiesterase [Nocardioides limicola]|uniref:RNA 2',3'-cyclic phosphodiesterase n=1 Tax=Nocardioides limicola TaxID=2803368 RepID=UPI001EEFC34C|nr:RNA 2',3'-cyclic phosphodiesterase [Nocardioides sp. DJM-14]